MRDPARILVVDDVPDNVEILRMRLESLGYEVVTAVDGEQGLAMAREALPDLILLDIMMPGIDGLEVVRRLKADRSLPFIPVIMVTAKATPKDVVAGLGIQVDNLCQFLPQDKVVAFAQLSPDALLLETEKALGDSTLYDLHQKLIRRLRVVQ